MKTINDFFILGFYGYCDGVNNFTRLYDLNAIKGSKLLIKKISWQAFANEETANKIKTDLGYNPTDYETSFANQNIPEAIEHRLYGFKPKLIISGNAWNFNQCSYGLPANGSLKINALTPYFIDSNGIDVSATMQLWKNEADLTYPYVKFLIHCFKVASTKRINDKEVTFDL